MDRGPMMVVVTAVCTECLGSSQVQSLPGSRTCRAQVAPGNQHSAVGTARGHRHGLSIEAFDTGAPQWSTSVARLSGSQCPHAPRRAGLPAGHILSQAGPRVMGAGTQVSTRCFPRRAPNTRRRLARRSLRPSRCRRPCAGGAREDSAVRRGSRRGVRVAADVRGVRGPLRSGALAPGARGGVSRWRRTCSRTRRCTSTT